jgi:hypothetical protein
VRGAGGRRPQRDDQSAGERRGEQRQHQGAGIGEDSEVAAQLVAEVQQPGREQGNAGHDGGDDRQRAGPPGHERQHGHQGQAGGDERAAAEGQHHQATTEHRGRRQRRAQPGRCMRASSEHEGRPGRREPQGGVGVDVAHRLDQPGVVEEAGTHAVEAQHRPDSNAADPQAPQSQERQGRRRAQRPQREESEDDQEHKRAVGPLPRHRGVIGPQHRRVAPQGEGAQRAQSHHQRARQLGRALWGDRQANGQQAQQGQPARDPCRDGVAAVRHGPRDEDAHAEAGRHAGRRSRDERAQGPHAAQARYRLGTMGRTLSGFSTDRWTHH